MYKSRCLALLPLLNFALAVITSEYSDESISDSTSADIPDSTFEGATKVSNHVWDALDGNQRELLASILKNLPGTPEATLTVDKASADQVGELGRHRHKEHKKYMSGKWDDSNEYEKAEDDYGKGNEADCCCYHRLTPTYHISLVGYRINLNDENDKYKTISLPAQGQPFVYGEDEGYPLPPLVKSECCQEYCYDPCCQPTAGIYGTNPEQKLCSNACDPCGHHLVPCHPQPPPHCPLPCQPPCGYPPPPCGCGCGCPPYGCPPPRDCPPPCDYPPPPCDYPPPPCEYPPCDYPPSLPCDFYPPPPPFIYDESCDKHKRKPKKHRGRCRS